MAAPQSSPLPEAPTRGEAEGQFVPKANAFVGALEPFRQQLQAQADFVNERSTETEENAALAQDASEMALSSANFAGDWSGLTGAFDVPTSVMHDDTYWQLLEDVSSIQDDEPGVSGAWAPINVARNVVLALPDITALASLNTAALVDGQQFSVASYLPDTSTGSALLRWRPELPKSRHDGVLFFSLTVPMFTGTDTTGYRNGVGETDSGGNGVMELVRGEIIYDAVVKCGSQQEDLYRSWNSAIKDIHGRIQPSGGAQIRTRLSSGSEVTEGVDCRDGNYGHFVLEAEDENPQVSDNYSTDRLLHVVNSRAPVLSCVVNGRSIANRGCWYTDGTIGVLNGGVTDVLERGLYVNGSSHIHGPLAVFRNAAQGGTGTALWPSRGSTVSCEHIDISGQAAGTGFAVYVSRNSLCHAAHLVCESFGGGTLIRAHRGSVFNANDMSNVKGGSGPLFSLVRNAKAIVNNSTFADVEGVFAEILDSLSSLDCQNCTIDASPGNNDTCFDIGSGNVNSIGAQITGFGLAAFVGRGGRWVSTLATIGGQSVGICEGQRGAQIHLTNATLSTDGGEAVRVGRGSSAWVFDTTVNGSAITPGDTNISAFNAIQGSSGIIWA